MDRVTRVGGRQGSRHEPPSPSPVAVLRPRLVEPLRARFERRLTVVEAGAGFGKSTLLGQVVRENQLERLGDDAWLALSERDRDPEHLVAGLGAAVGLTDDRPTVDDVIDAVWARAPTSVALILDDTHLLDGAEGAWAVIGTLVDRLPANGHVVVSGRRSPQLPVARLLSQGEAVVLDEADLAFTGDELVSFADQRELPASLVADLPIWPALAALTGAVGHRASIHFVWDEVLAGLPAERRRLLGAVASFGELDDDLVAAVGGTCTAADLVGALPLVDVTEDGAFRLHDLWGDALAGTIDDHERRTALRAGGKELLARGELVRAAEAFALAGDDEGLDQVVLAFARRPAMASSTPEIDQLHRLLPPSMAGRPSTRYLEAARHYATDDRRAALLFDVAACEAQAAGELELETMARWRVVQFDDLDGTAGAELSPRLAELAGAGVPLARSVLAFVDSRRAQDEGDVDAALAALDGLDEFDDGQQATSRAIRLIDLGRPEDLPATLESVLASGVDDIYDAQAVWLQGLIDPDDAWPIARRLPERAGELAAITRVSLLSVVATMAVAAGAEDEAAALVEQARRSAPTVARVVQAFPEVAGALVELVAVDEATAVASLERQLAAVPLGRWPERPYLYALAALRGLVPGGEVLDDCPFGPSLTVAVEAGAALAALRAGNPAPARALPWAEPALLRVHVPPPLLAELALAAGDAPGARRVLLALPHLRRWMRRVADRSEGRLGRSAADLLRTLPARPAWDLRIDVLGGLRLRRSDGDPLDGWDRRERVRQLLALLALEREVPRAAVASRLWPELPPEKAAANLRVNLTHLQQVLQPDRDPGEPPWFLRADGTHLRLVGDGITVDRDELDRAVAAAVEAEAAGLATRAVEHYRRAGELYVGDLLPEADDAWLGYERIRLRSLAHAAVARHGELVLACGEPEEAMGLALRAQRLDPLSERAHRLFIRCHLTVGSAAAARAAGAALRRELDDAGITLEPETASLLDRLGV